ncbi:uncharacterized protein LOC141922115 isoform X3 [Strix aluco]|uniref:uncharacterized protein LOC141922115 isoform X3 n=1 Tax=Strix aluco TaxID=111821 RepID=UPI003DA3762F
MLSERGRAEAALVCSCPGVLLTAPTSGLCEVSLPGLALLTAQGQKGTGGALPGCGQRTGAAAAEAGETRESGRKRKSRPSVQHPPPSAGRESLPLCVRKEPSSQSDRQRAPRVCVRHPKRGTATQATGVSEEEEGQEEGRRKKHLTRQILPAVPRTRAAFQSVVGPDDLQEFPSHLKPFCSSGVTAVTSRAVSYHRREKVAPGFKAIPSACCFTPATALLKKRRRKLWLTKLCHNRDCSRQHHGMLIMTSTGLAVLSFSLLLAVDLQWSLIRGKRLYNSKWSYKADPDFEIIKRQNNERSQTVNTENENPESKDAYFEPQEQDLYAGSLDCDNLLDPDTVNPKRQPGLCPPLAGDDRG